MGSKLITGNRKVAYEFNIRHIAHALRGEKRLATQATAIDLDASRGMFLSWAGDNRD
jgi:hypothetical protein